MFELSGYNFNMMYSLANYHLEFFEKMSACIIFEILKILY